MHNKRVGIGITDLARSKQDRFLDPEWVKYEVRRLVDRYPECDDQELWSKGHYTSEFHLVFPEEDFVLVLTDKVDYITVITQMHMHPNYASSPIYSIVGDDRWAKRFGSRQPAQMDYAEHRKALDVDIDDRMRVSPATVPREEFAGVERTA